MPPGTLSNAEAADAGVNRSAMAPGCVTPPQASRCTTEPAERLSTSVSCTPKSTLSTKSMSKSHVPDTRVCVMSMVETLFWNTLPVTIMSSGVRGLFSVSSKTGRSEPK